MRNMSDEQIDMQGHEFTSECGTPKCDKPAKWMGWVSHSAKVCPNSTFACEKCKSVVDNWWNRVMKSMETHDINCQKCGELVEGELQEHLRWLPL